MFHVSRLTDRDEARIGVFYNGQLIVDVTARRVSTEVIDVDIHDGMNERINTWSDIIEEPA